ncbi:MAG: hypothetical protein KatS3mg103_0859 [Phycisphaerales bacterium]|nr:MAG: hypothetical protein KatS3mg103_0859 [Phycisphaerales bacterium]
MPGFFGSALHLVLHLVLHLALARTGRGRRSVSEEQCGQLIADALGGFLGIGPPRTGRRRGRHRVRALVARRNMPMPGVPTAAGVPIAGQGCRPGRSVQFGRV